MVWDQDPVGSAFIYLRILNSAIPFPEFVSIKL